MEVTPSKIRGILIDLDGTFVDHIQTITRCFQYACRELGFQEPTAEKVKRSIGGSMPVTIQKFLPPEQVEAGKEIWRRRFEEIHLQGVIVLHGADELLDHCNSSGIKAAIFTNKTGRHSRAIIENEGYTERFEFVLGAEDTPYRKPQPEYSAAAIEKIGIPGEQLAMVGDSPFDIEAARAGGMAAICVTTGSHNREELLNAGADKVFDSLAEVSHWLAFGN
ncbi:HAD family hydrolase [Pelagicoccus sp. NFK12]|jgi:phosphoglycolate phosphatase|uniref:HAD family hydrolase n=1 Tax=Pelagicoccus enzymogenes TaxID=2773457 RepID=A0A927FCQ0_9BACT|nr:HAD family hydrolase [Pelagicoccus enzymogenes]MBD5782617.1 HAD family hydrolase [Pelagicoccus enzymogenes]